MEKWDAYLEGTITSKINLELYTGVLFFIKSFKEI
jgi:hypothetical protein